MENNQKKIAENTAFSFSPEDIQKLTFFEKKKLTSIIKKMRDKAAVDPIYFCDNFLRTHDSKKNPSDLPFKLYPYQKRYIRRLLKCIDDGEDIFVDKTRQMGVSYVTLALLLWLWLFRPGFTALVGSRKQDLVDGRKGGTIGSKDESLFAKLGYMLERLPPFLMPVGFEKRKHFTFMTLVNPENGSSITGESSNADFSRGGNFSCVVGNTLVHTKEGIKTIKEAMNDGDTEIWCADGKLRKIKAYIKKPPEPLLKLTTKFGFEITGTKDHPVKTNNGVKKLSEIVSGDKIHISSNNIFGECNLLTEDSAEILGWLVSEGCVNKNSHIGFANKDEEVITRYIEKYKNAFGVDLSTFKRKIIRTYDGGKTNYIFSIEKSDIKTREELYRLGLERVKAGEKSVPWSILISPKKIQKAFLRSLFEGDGSVSKPKSLNNRLSVVYATKSPVLAQQIQIMLLSYGILCSKRHLTRTYDYTTTSGNISKNFTYDIYILKMSGYYAKKFCDEIGFLSKRKKSVSVGYISSNIVPHNKHYRLDADGGWFLPLKSIQAADKDYTYDIEIENYHLFSTNGITSHNCIILDEFAFWNESFAVWGATADATRCRVVITTPGEKPGKAKRLRFGLDGEKILIYEISFKEHPEKDAKWLAAEKERRSEEDFNREIMIDWGLSIKGRIYPELEKAQYGKFPFIPSEQLYVSGDYGLDGTVFLFWQRNPENGKWRLVDSISYEEEPIEYSFPLWGKPIDSAFTYDNFFLKAIEEINKYPPGVHFGDPSINKRSGNKEKESDRDKLAKVGVYVTSYAQDNSIDYRVKQTKIFLKNGLEVNESERNYVSFDLMKQYRWKTWDEDHDSTATFRKPVHNQASHYATAMEYMAVNILNFTQIDPNEPEPSKGQVFLTSRNRIARFGRRR